MKKSIFLLLSLTLLSYAKENFYDFNLTTVAGDTIHVETTEKETIFKEHNQSVTFMLFFGHNCKPCLKEIPELIALSDKKHSDLKLLAVDIHGYNQEDLKKFKEEKKINYPLLTREGNRRFTAYIKAKTKWRGSLPFMVVFNKKGEAKLAHRGALTLKKFEAIYGAVRK